MRQSYLLAFLLLPIIAFARNYAQTPPFPDDPGELYVPSVIVIMGDTIDVSDSTATVTEIDVLGDSTILYDTEDNVLTLTNVDLAVGDSLTAAISYAGTDALTIVLCDSSSIIADTVITSQSDVIITGDGMLVAEGTVPIIGTRNATITFDSVTMFVRSLPGAQAVRRRIRGGKRLDETGGPALSGFGSADFNKTNVTPEDASYGPIPCSGDDCNDDDEEEEYALYVVNEEGDVEVLTEFELNGVPDETDAVTDTRQYRHLDGTQPMYNMLGMPVDDTYRGLVIQGGQTFLLH